MAPCIEILRVAASDAYKAEGAAVFPEFFKILSSTKGLAATFQGTEAGDPGHWWGFLLWDSLEAHQALMNDKEVYPKLGEALMKGSTKIEFMHHATVSENPYPAFEAPVTEVAIWTLHEGTEKKDFEALFEPFITKLLAAPIVHAGGWAPTVENDRKYAIILGWNGVEEFHESIKNPESQWALEAIGNLKKIADVELKLIPVKKY